MAERIHWSLLARVTVFGAAFFWLPLWAFLVIAIFLYVKPWFQVRKYLISFLVLLALLSIAHATLAKEYSGIWYVLAGCGGMAAFFLLLGSKDLILIDREQHHLTLTMILVFGVALVYFWFSRGVAPTLITVGVFTALIGLFGEWYGYVAGETGNASLPPFFYALVMGFISFQMLWALALLPIGFLNAAALAITLIFFANEAVVRSLRGNLTRKNILLLGTVFALLLFLVASFSLWSF